MKPIEIWYEWGMEWKEGWLIYSDHKELWKTEWTNMSFLERNEAAKLLRKLKPDSIKYGTGHS